MNLLEKAIHSDNVPNLVIYGDKYTPKYQSTMTILSQRYDCTFKESFHSFGYRRSEFVHEFNLRGLKNANKTEFENTLRRIAHQSNYFANSKNVILLINFNQIKPAIQSFLRVYLEKYRKTTIFIIITDNFTSVHEALRSRSLCIRMSDCNLREQITDKTNDPYEIVCLKITTYLSKDFVYLTTNDIQRLRDISYQILKYNLDLSEFGKKLCEYIGKCRKFTNTHKGYLIHIISTFQHTLKDAYRTILHIESLLYDLYDASSFKYYEMLSDSQGSTRTR